MSQTSEHYSIIFTDNNEDARTWAKFNIQINIQQ